MKTKPITFQEQLEALTHAAYILKGQRPYLKGMDIWEIINGAWLVMEEQNCLDKLDTRGQKYALLTACINAGKTFINRQYKLRRANYRADLAFLNISINGDVGYAFDMPDVTPSPDGATNTSELFRHVMAVARKVLNVTEYRTIELYYLQGLKQDSVSNTLGYRTRSSTCMRLKTAIQKIRNELSVTGNLLEMI